MYNIFIANISFTKGCENQHEKYLIGQIVGL